MDRQIKAKSCIGQVWCDEYAPFIFSIYDTPDPSAIDVNWMLQEQLCRAKVLSNKQQDFFIISDISKLKNKDVVAQEFGRSLHKFLKCKGGLNAFIGIGIQEAELFLKKLFPAEAVLQEPKLYFFSRFEEALIFINEKRVGCCN
jgi:hypothetical protein